MLEYRLRVCRSLLCSSAPRALAPGTYCQRLLLVTTDRKGSDTPGTGAMSKNWAVGSSFTDIRPDQRYGGLQPAAIRDAARSPRQPGGGRDILVSVAVSRRDAITEPDQSQTRTRPVTDQQ